VESVRLNLNGKTVSVLCKCRVCRTVQQYSVADAIAGPVTCIRCGRQMNIKGAVIEAVDSMPGARTGQQSGTGSSDDSNSEQSADELLNDVRAKAAKRDK
jgi:hypothetical protein